MPIGEISDGAKEEGGESASAITNLEDKKIAMMLENINTVPASQLRETLTLARSKTLQETENRRNASIAARKAASNVQSAMQDVLSLFGERFEAEKKVINHKEIVTPKKKIEKTNSLAMPSIPNLNIPGLKLPGLLQNLQTTIQEVTTETVDMINRDKSQTD